MPASLLAGKSRPPPRPHRSLQVYKNLGGPAAIERHTEALRAWLYGALSALRHSNGAPLLRILGRHVEQSASGGGPLVQGATFNFQILTPDGQPFSYRTASGVLAQAGFHMRCGCTCNPGACYSEGGCFWVDGSGGRGAAGSRVRRCRRRGVAN